MPSIKINQDKCKGCKLCIIYCPKQQIKISEDLNNKGMHYAVFKDEGKCTGCGICARVCPDVAIEVFLESTDDRVQRTDKKRKTKKG